MPPDLIEKGAEISGLEIAALVAAILFLLPVPPAQFCRYCRERR